MSKKVLVVDDTETIRRYEEMILSREGYDVEMAADGIEALAKIRAHQPDVVFLDIMMPRMDGIECCRQIKTDDATKEIKVVMVTTKSEYEKVKEAFEAGCDDYITKPIDRNELITKANDLMKFMELRKLLRA